MTAAGFMLAFVGVILLIAGAAQAAQNRSFAQCSALVTGRVVRKRNRNVKNGVAHELTISYTVDGISYEKTLNVLISQFDATAEGDSFELKYRPDKPKKAVRPEDTDPKNVKVVLIVGTVLVLVGAALFVFGRM